MNHMEFNQSTVGLILAAGRSERMGRPKLNLPWRDTTVLGSVIRNISAGGINRVFIVVNPLRRPDLPPNLPELEINWIDNESAETNEMLVSIQTGLKALPTDVETVFVFLGDQPAIQSWVVTKMAEEVSQSKSLLIFPSYRMRRGHPWVVRHALWSEIQKLEKNDTVRTFIRAYEQEIQYVNFDLDLPADMDTP
ncbi:MAG TPA: nucleotidyltransferase family protein, partial [Leptolinea sp.]